LKFDLTAFVEVTHLTLPWTTSTHLTLRCKTSCTVFL